MLIVSCFFFFKQKTAYEMRISDWSSDVCSSDLELGDGALDRLGDRVRPEAELLRPDEGDVGDPHEAEQGPKVRLLAVAGDARSLTVEPAARFDQDRKSVV